MRSLHKLNNELTTLEDLYLNFTCGIPVKTLSTSITEIPWTGLLKT